MTRKDCDDMSSVSRRRPLRPANRMRRLLAAGIVSAVALCASADARAGSARLWPLAVVVDDTVRLSDVCELRGFDEPTERTLRQLVVTQAPPAGGSRMLHMEMIRSALASGGANMAVVTLTGAMQCAVSRPSDATSESAQSASKAPGDSVARAAVEHRRRKASGRRDNTTLAPAAGGQRVSAGASGDSPSNQPTLRQAVVDYFDREFARYRGTADVIFDRTSQKVLDLSGPTYKFTVRRRGGPPLGLIPLEVDVVAEDRVLQTVPLVVQVAMNRDAVVARRSINQGATIAAADLDVMPMSFMRLDKLGVDDVSQAIGQRAKRFTPAGRLIEPVILESVPLVLRGQLVTLTSNVGFVRITTTAKAADTGLLGDVIKVRASDNKRVEFDAVVVGPGAVQIGSAPAVRSTATFAMKDQP